MVTTLWASAAAALSPPVRVTVDRCESITEPEVRRILSAELGMNPPNNGGTSVTEVTVTCDDTRVIVRVRDPISRKTMQRSFDLGTSDPRGRSRLVALASSELILASWAELQVNPRLKVTPEGPEPSPELVRSARETVDTFEYHPKPRPSWYESQTPPDRMLRLTFLGSVRSFLNHEGTLWGGGARIGEERFHTVSWSADFLFEAGEVHNGMVDYHVETGAIGAWLLLYKRWGIFTGRAGAGLRLVAVSSSRSFAAEPEGSTTIAPWGWPLAASSVTLRVAPPLVLELSGEIGYAVLPVPNASDPSVRGAWFSGQFGVGIAL